MPLLLSCALKSLIVSAKKHLPFPSLCSVTLDYTRSLSSAAVRGTVRTIRIGVLLLLQLTTKVWRPEVMLLLLLPKRLAMEMNLRSRFLQLYLLKRISSRDVEGGES